MSPVETSVPIDGRQGAASTAQATTSNSDARPDVVARAGGVPYWRSLDEIADTPEFRKFVEMEYPKASADLFNPVTRRTFMKVMGASLALAGLTACRYPKQKILPYAARDEGFVPGAHQHFATAMELSGFATPLLVTSYDHRPIKIEGNPDHPLSLGATSAFAQASLLGLYDPERSRRPSQYTTESWQDSGWEALWKDLGPKLKATAGKDGEGLHILSGAIGSPTLWRLREQLRARLPKMQWHEYEPLSRDNEREGIVLAYGKALRPHYNLLNADVVATFDDDLLLQHPAMLRHQREFAARRAVEREDSHGHSVVDVSHMNRLYAIESTFTSTGSIADHRIAVPSSAIPAVIAHLAHEIFVTHKQPLPDGSTIETNGTNQARFLASIQKFATVPKGWEFIPVLAKDLLDHAGHGLVTVGVNQPVETHALVHLINASLRNVGPTATVSYTAERERPTHFAAINALAKALNEDKVDVLLVLGGDPTTNAPSELNFREAITKAKTSVHLSSLRNDTSIYAEWHAPESHYLESWGDAVAYDGTLSVVQPLIAPLYHSLSPIEFIAASMNAALGENVAAKDGYELVRKTLAPASGFLADREWNKVVHDGFAAGSAAAPVMDWPAGSPRGPQPRVQAVVDLLANVGTAALSKDALEVTFREAPTVYDGRFVNNAWLHENPEVLTKLTWDNAALIGPATSDELGVKQGDMVTVALGEDRKLLLPVYVMPGQAKNSIAVWVGYGALNAGRVSKDVGFDVYHARTTANPWIATGATVSKVAGLKHRLACTQDHWALDATGQGETQRRIPLLVREAAKNEFKKHPDFAQHLVHQFATPGMIKNEAYDRNYKWGVAVDLNVCTGCNACTIACQSENNIAVVGKEQILNGREMNWLRIDRYFRGDPNNPAVAHQPMFCAQCENAPCEQVCPVAATVHDAEGINNMVYNRCIGTRYCSNNCPFKVRRFNFFDYRANALRGPAVNNSPVEGMGNNPDVTVRMRGVMEKCTYCIQRISRGRIDAAATHRKEGKEGDEVKRIKDGTIKSACQQTCPTGAIVFGDLNDPESAVAKAHAKQRTYQLIEELNLETRTKYMARIGNPNPDMPEAFTIAMPHYESHGSHGHDDHGHGHDDHGHDDHSNGNGRGDSHDHSNDGNHAD